LHRLRRRGREFGEPAANEQHLCAQCMWLRDIEDPVEREALRAWLQKIGER
jgi:hypothetical protein